MHVVKTKDLTLDQHNANRGTDRGRGLLEQSLREHRAGRSILVDCNGRVIAGNKTVQSAAGVGIEEVIMVRTDGTQLVAVQRTDLDVETAPAARALAYADNRSVVRRRSSHTPGQPPRSDDLDQVTAVISPINCRYSADKR